MSFSGFFVLNPKPLLISHLGVCEKDCTGLGVQLKCSFLTCSACIENVSEQLKGQGTDVQEGHQAILNDLAEVRGRAQEIYSKMGTLQQNTFHFTLAFLYIHVLVTVLLCM